MAPHSSTLAWKIPWMEEPGRLQSMGSLRVRHDCMTSLSLFTFMHWRRKWQPTPVFLPGEFQGRGFLVGFCLWGHTESDMTEVTQQQQQQQQQGEGRKEQRNISTNYFWDTVFTGKFLAMKYIRKKSLDLITSASTLRNQNKNKLSPK